MWFIVDSCLVRPSKEPGILSNCVVLSELQSLKIESVNVIEVLAYKRTLDVCRK